MPTLTATALRAVHLRFGDDADNVLALREAGKTVRPYGDQFSVDEVIMDGDGLQRLADQLRAREEARARRAAANTAPTRRTKSPAEWEKPPVGEGACTTAINDGPGGALASLPASDVAGNAGGGHDAGLTPAPEVARPAPPATAPALRPTQLRCEKCGGARSKWSVALCRACYVPAGRKPNAAPQTADAPDKFVRLADMVASREPAPVQAPTNAERDADIAVLKRQVAELRERLDQFTSEGR